MCESGAGIQGGEVADVGTDEVEVAESGEVLEQSEGFDICLAGV